MARGRTQSNGGFFELAGKLIVNVVALLVVEAIVPGFELLDLQSAVIAAIVIGVVNMFIRPVAQFIALPLSILTLGIAAFVVNVLLLMLAAAIVPGFEIQGFLTAAIASIILAVVNAFLHKIASNQN